MIAPDLKARVFDERMELGMSQAEMAAHMGVSVDVVRNLEATGNRPRWANARKVATFFKTTPNKLWPVVEDAEHEPVKEQAA